MAPPNGLVAAFYTTTPTFGNGEIDFENVTNHYGDTNPLLLSTWKNGGGQLPVSAVPQRLRHDSVAHVSDSMGRRRLSRGSSNAPRFARRRIPTIYRTSRCGWT